MAGALIVAAKLAATDFAWLEGLRRQYYPAERNRVPAHLTLFHALPPSAEQEVKRSLACACAAPPPQAVISGVMDLGGAVAFRVRSDELDHVREELARDFHGLLNAQDRGGWLPHVTIQNKVSPTAARKVLGQLKRGFRSRQIVINGLQLVRYLESGLWEPLGSWSFRGVS